MKKTISLFAIIFTVCSINAYAQFEGKIAYKVYEMDNGSQQQKENFTAFITPQRILFQGSESMEVPGNIETQGLLVRLDKKDFVLFTSSNSALSITKSEVTSFMNMFGQKSSGTSSKIKKSVNIEQTGETKTIGGYQAQKFVITDPNEKNKKAVLWMTQEVDINWGMIADPWGNSMQFMTDDDFPTKLIFKEGWLPLQGEFYEKGQVEGGLTAKVQAVNVDKSRVHLSPDVTVKSLGQYLFNSMRQKK